MREDRIVSIPFIAGQWSLQRSKRSGVMPRRLFQSPSLRGSGRFNNFAGSFFDLFHVSIPFIAGQWSLQIIMP